MIAFEKMAECYNNKVANILHVVLDYENIVRILRFESHRHSSRLSCRCAEVCE